MADDPQALINAAARALSVGKPHAASNLADLVERIGQGLCSSMEVGFGLTPRVGRTRRSPAERSRMKAFGTDVGVIHFVGIGGIGMSGIAEVGHQARLQGAGLGHRRGLYRGGAAQARHPDHDRPARRNLGDAAVIVISSAVSRGNPEVEALSSGACRIVRRAEMLTELMRMQKTIAVAGTHRKTTTTSMVAAMLDAGGLDPTVINGGIINRYGSNARLGKSDWMVVEADESDGSFLRLDGTIAISNT